jgi:hypothetical protein
VDILIVLLALHGLWKSQKQSSAVDETSFGGKDVGGVRIVLVGRGRVKRSLTFCAVGDSAVSGAEAP